MPPIPVRGPAKKAAAPLAAQAKFLLEAARESASTCPGLASQFGRAALNVSSSTVQSVHWLPDIGRYLSKVCNHSLWMIAVCTEAAECTAKRSCADTLPQVWLPSGA